MQARQSYAEVDGSHALKQAIIAKFERDNSLTFQGDEVLISSGAKQSLYNACSVSQAAATAVLSGDRRPVAAMCAEFKAPHEFVLDGINALAGRVALDRLRIFLN